MTSEFWKSVLKGAAVAAIGAAFAVVSQAISGVDFGPYIGPLVTASMAVVANIVRKLTTETK